MNQKKIFAANWKLNKGPAEARQFMTAFKVLAQEFSTKCDVIFFPSAIAADAVSAQLQGSWMQWGPQNTFWQDSGAFTGENSLKMFCDLNAKWNLVGHSERRQYFGETDHDIAKKILASFDHRMNPMFCIGETKVQRLSGQTRDVLITQLSQGLSESKHFQFGRLVVAYEPVWAIGTGLVATDEQVQETHLWIRNWLNDNGWKNSLILYGGSVKPEVVPELIKRPHVDGFLVGGASLDPLIFHKLIKAGVTDI